MYPNIKAEIDGVTYTVASPYVGIDERKLSITDRLGLAYCRLNSYEWDDLLAGEPATDTSTCCRKMMAIQEIIGEANTSRCWWKFNLGRTEDEWREWYYNKQYSPEPTADRIDYSRQSSDGKECSSKKLKHLPNLIRSLFFKE